MKKQITVNNNIIRILVEQGYCTENIFIEKTFLNNNELEKTISFSIWDDMSFRTYIHNDDLYSDIMDLSFEINIEDKIYFALNRLLGIDDSLVIDDDDTREKLKNYMEFKREKNKFIITFHDEDIDKALFERFNVFIKNIGPDGRSKIEDFNIKYRLVKFFREAKAILINEYHQYTFDEYFEILKYEGLYEGVNPFLPKINKWFKNPSESCLNCFRECDKEKSIDYWCNSYLNREEVKKLVK